MDETGIFLHTRLKGLLPRRFLQSEALSIAAWFSPGPGGFGKLSVFKLRAPSFHLELSIDGNRAVLQRNRHSVVLSMASSPRPADKGRCFVAATLSPTAISLYVSGTGTTENTPYTLPPNALIDWARRQDVLPVVCYESETEFLDTVLNGLDGLQGKVDVTAMQVVFWDFECSGKKISKRTPKKETHIHPAIHGLLHDFVIAKNLELLPEAAAGTGRMDFLVMGQLVSGKVVKACIEFKLAHSDDVIRGVTVQLPDYMRTHGTDNGFYCVPCFKGEHFAKPEEGLSALRTRLLMEKNAIGLNRVGLVMIDLSLPLPPSKA